MCPYLSSMSHNTALILLNKLGRWHYGLQPTTSFRISGSPALALSHFGFHTIAAAAYSHVSVTNNPNSVRRLQPDLHSSLSPRTTISSHTHRQLPLATSSSRNRGRAHRPALEPIHLIGHSGVQVYRPDRSTPTRDHTSERVVGILNRESDKPVFRHFGQLGTSNPRLMVGLRGRVGFTELWGAWGNASHLAAPSLGGRSGQ